MSHDEFVALASPILATHTEELQQFLEKCSAQPDYRMGSNVKFPSWEQGIIIKYGIERIENANRLRTVIQEKSLQHVGIPLKFLYHVPGRPLDLDSTNYLVIVQRIPRMSHKFRFAELNRDQVRCIYKLAIQGPHYDMHALNWILSGDDKVYIIDTDEGAMPSADKIEELHQDWLIHFDHLDSPHGGMRMNPSIINHPLVKIRLHMASKHCCFNTEAYSYMHSKIRKYRQSHSSSMMPIVPAAEPVAATSDYLNWFFKLFSF